jgi:hypothetical protein
VRWPVKRVKSWQLAPECRGLKTRPILVTVAYAPRSPLKNRCKKGYSSLELRREIISQGGGIASPFPFFGLLVMILLPFFVHGVPWRVG